ncbi:nicotinate-nucleotide adenylyltransferase [Commensalibacter oyaizuii]|uniref:Probable nicotinate-nucleotide adenylyltransferase n=1 Tax=Commensalibacter oyaizuii TaxID=3043873 RepID=A0ABT6Q179_9PROT|nr:nicotinate-nucleotide adenylyltransferase [Commensalibacter sp. TBRC 16381]MDI2090855.1 nicotinate-nucleotide adenylyltransferase [Commensalibacter sp. TBRC 16381]
MIAIPTWGDRRRIRVGLFGGSFNPIHEGHLQLADRALKFLRLDQVWLMVSPGNPLKVGTDMAPFEERYQKVKANLSGRRLIATDIESRLHTRYSCDTIKIVQQRFPCCKFVWLMGADGLAQMALWSHWQEILRLVPMAVFPRPSYIYTALKGQAAQWARETRLPSRYSTILADCKAPAWVFVPAPENTISATALRLQQKQLLEDSYN